MDDREVEDVLKRLPPRAAEAFRSLAEQAQERWGAVDALNRKFRETIDERDKLSRARSYQIADREKARDHAAVAELRREVDVIAKRAAGIAEQRDRATERWQEVAGLVRRLADFVLEAPRGKGFRDLAIEAPTIPNSDLHGALEGRRRRLRELVADAHRVRSAPRPSAAARELIRREIDRIAERGRPDVTHAVEVGGGELANVVEFARNRNTGEVDVVALLAWVCKDQLLAALDREVAEISDDAAALSDAERAEALATIERDQLAVEREEEAIARQIEQTGSSVRRRVDADVRAVLMVEEVDVKVAADPPRPAQITGWEPPPRHHPAMGLDAVDRNRAAAAGIAAARGDAGGLVGAGGGVEAAAVLGTRPAPALHAGSDHVGAHGPAGFGDEVQGGVPDVDDGIRDEAARYKGKSKRSGRG
ncbi:hypothetical protein [Rhodoplanes azumiensis]|uniref:Uncharacterized protein n=1 Tax=Rhodoplanes azumiensis TaxID=1897628 RepID=A0ABW5APU9_9BRAD